MVFEAYLPLEGFPTEDELRLAEWHANAPMLYGSRSWEYIWDDPDALKPYLREANEMVEMWSARCKRLGREADEFSRREMKAWKRHVKALNWLRGRWEGTNKIRDVQGGRAVPHELEPLIARYAALVELDSLK